jgi:hypothetical protein
VALTKANKTGAIQQKTPSEFGERIEEKKAKSELLLSTQKNHKIGRDGVSMRHE